MLKPENYTEDYVLVRTDAVGLNTILLETEDSYVANQAYEAAALNLMVDDKLVLLRRATLVIASAVGVDPSTV